MKKEILAYLASLKEHFTGLATGSLPIAFLLVLQACSVNVPVWIYIAVVIISIPSACFFTWRDEHRKVSRLEHRLALAERSDGQKLELKATLLPKVDEAIEIGRRYLRDLRRGVNVAPHALKDWEERTAEMLNLYDAGIMEAFREGQNIAAFGASTDINRMIMEGFIENLENIHRGLRQAWGVAP